VKLELGDRGEGGTKVIDVASGSENLKHSTSTASDKTSDAEHGGSGTIEHAALDAREPLVDLRDDSPVEVRTAVDSGDHKSVQAVATAG